jgi:hypothetical protein
METPEKIYFYLKWNYTGYDVTGIQKVEDKDFNRIRRKWLKESKWDITPIMEGFDIKRKD